MTDLILKELNHCKIQVYRIHQEVTEGEEAYYFGHTEDILRQKRICEYTVTVFRDYQREGKAMRGSASVQLLPGMTAEEIRDRLEAAYRSAAVVEHPFYELPRAEKQECGSRDHDGDSRNPGNGITILRSMAEAMFAEKMRPETELSYLELFHERHFHRVLGSGGTDVRYSSERYTGEFAVRCRKPKDVEIYSDFSLKQGDGKALALCLKEKEKLASDRAEAKKNMLTSGQYRVLFTGHQVYELLRMYLVKSRADLILTGCSAYRTGETVQKAGQGERLSLWLPPEADYNEEGVRTEELPLLEAGVLRHVHGELRFCRQLGEEPCGLRKRIRCENGSFAMEELKTSGCLIPAVFSDFLMDGSSGNFAGEIRLAYYYKDGCVSCLTGGSVSGNLAELEGNLFFSRERFEDALYEGPKAVRVDGVQLSCG